MNQFQQEVNNMQQLNPPVAVNRRESGELVESDSSVSRKRKAEEAIEEEDASRMELTPQEREWALATKEAIEADEEVLARAITDMEIACFAIIDQGDIDRSVERAICMQAFRMQHNINDCVDEAMKLLRDSEEDHPRTLLSIDECPNDDGLGSHLMVQIFQSSILKKFWKRVQGGFEFCWGRSIT